MKNIFEKLKGVGTLDYVCAWYKKAVDLMSGTAIKAAFVSTNSITQGEQATILWKSLMESGVFINFGVTTFKWSNEAKGFAAVHCVIIGFSYIKTEPNINQYLIQAPNVFIESRSKPICDVPKIFYGSMPIDNGALILSEEERNKMIKSEPLTERYIKSYIGGDELLNKSKRFCLWLKNISPNEWRSIKAINERVSQCREFRNKSNRPQTKQLAGTPSLFGEIRQPNTEMLVIPKVSSENRKYLPISFVSPDTIVNGSALIIPSATLFHFGILMSNVHNAWMRTTCGRMKSDYQYSGSIVYNNFPWAETNEKQKADIEKLAQRVLDARDLYSECSLADLYDPNAMPPELIKAHKALDKVVMKIYGFGKDCTEGEIVAGLMGRYEELTRND